MQSEVWERTHSVTMKPSSGLVPTASWEHPSQCLQCLDLMTHEVQVPSLDLNDRSIYHLHLFTPQLQSHAAWLALGFSAVQEAQRMSRQAVECPPHTASSSILVMMCGRHGMYARLMRSSDLQVHDALQLTGTAPVDLEESLPKPIILLVQCTHFTSHLVTPLSTSCSYLDSNTVVSLLNFWH